MVTYYNLSKFGETEGVMGMFQITSSLTNNYFGLMIVALVFLIPTYAMIKEGKDVNTSLHYSSLFATLIAIIFYVTQIVTLSLIIYVPALIYAITIIVKWYNR